MNEIQIDPRQDIETYLKIYHKPSAVFGVTMLDVPGQKHSLLDNDWASGTIAGYFNDYSVATDAIFRAEQEMNPGMIMMSINPCKADCLALADNRFKKGCPPFKTDFIDQVENLVIDFDPARPLAKIAANNAEKEYAKDKAMACMADMKAVGFPTPSLIDSGNGYHLVLKVEPMPLGEGAPIIKNVTESISAHYSDDRVIVDVSVAAPGHPIRVAGTMNRKGENLPERPHRRSSVISVPSTLQVLPKATLLEIVQKQVVEPERNQIMALPTLGSGSIASARLNVQAWLDSYKRQIKRIVRDAGATIYTLVECPFDPIHTNGEASIIQRDDGTAIFFCFHDSCRIRQWSDVRAAISGTDSLQQFVEGGKISHEPLAGSVISMQELVNTNFPTIPPLIENLIYPGSSTILSAAGGTGKSLFSKNIALSLASPLVNSFLNLSVFDQANTLILQTENAAIDTKHRLQSMAKHPGFSAGLGNVYSCTSNLNDIRILNGDLTKDTFLDRIYQDIQATNAKLLVIDPLISVNPGDENDNSHMRRMLDRLTHLMSVTGISILVAHHVGRAGGNGSTFAGRGASAVGDWCHNSFLLKTSDPKTGTLELSCQKARNFAKPDPIHMKLNPHTLVFERVYPQGQQFNAVYSQRIVTDTLRSLGGIANTQQDLIDAILASEPDLNKTKAHCIIKDTVNSGAIVEGMSGRKKTYHLPQQQPASPDASQRINSP